MYRDHLHQWCLEMARYALKDSTGKVVNVIALEPQDLGTKWNPPAGFTVERDDNARIDIGLVVRRAKRLKLKDLTVGTTSEYEVVQGL
mgnify:CR=1 FL=1